jgi:uncharacterized protein YqeY
MAERTSTGSDSGEDAAEVTKLRLRRDLKASMEARDGFEVSVLRALIAALDNAQAVPAQDKHTRYVVRKFGDPATEVPRQRLDAGEVQMLLEGEIKSRRDAADQLEQLGKMDRATDLRAEAAIVAQYLIH